MQGFGKASSGRSDAAAVSGSGARAAAAGLEQPLNGARGTAASSAPAWPLKLSTSTQRALEAAGLAGAEDQRRMQRLMATYLQTLLVGGLSSP